MTAQRLGRYEIRISATAADDLRDIRAWIAQRSPDSTDIVIRRLRAAAESRSNRCEPSAARGRSAPRGISIHGIESRQTCSPQAFESSTQSRTTRSVKVHAFVHHARLARELD